MLTKTITAKALRSNLREVIMDIDTNNTDYILEYVKGLKVKISPIRDLEKKSKFGNYLKTRKFKSSKNSKNYTNDELRKIAYGQ
ncbi:MAG: hypothetical protein WCK98_05105 [bacterium]